jgi:hypothetical protein
MRLSEGNFDVPEASGLTPTMAMKFLRDGTPSVNIVANTSFAPSNSFNFFANNFRTTVELFQDPIEIQTIQKKFREIGPHIQTVGKRDLAEFTADNSIVSNPVFPFDLYFKPNPNVTAMWPHTRQYDIFNNPIPFYDQLAQIPVDTILFRVMAKKCCSTKRTIDPDPIEFEDTVKADDSFKSFDGADLNLHRNLQWGGGGDDPIKDECPYQHIGNIRLKSRLTKCEFGDMRLFFQHTDIEHDLKL